MFISQFIYLTFDFFLCGEESKVICSIVFRIILINANVLKMKCLLYMLAATAFIFRMCTHTAYTRLCTHKINNHDGKIYKFSITKLPHLMFTFVYVGAFIFVSIESGQNHIAKELNDSMMAIRANLTAQLWEITMTVNTFERDKYLDQ